MITEAFLQYIWRLRRFDAQQLHTANSHEAVEVLHTGELNQLSGPDFFNARIKIGDTIWAGNVEIHVRASDWLRHGHQTDRAYQNVVLHVVYESDVPLNLPNGAMLPVVELQHRISPTIYRNYAQLQHTDAWIPCAKLIADIDVFSLNHWLDRLSVERLEQKIAPLLHLLQQNLHSWDEVCYQAIARALGTNANGQAMEMLARSLPLTVLGKHKNSLLQIEALLFGQAGLLTDRVFTDDYPQQLQREYHFLRTKFSLQPLLASVWKMGGVRPPNLPTIRIAQLAGLIYASSGLFSQLLAAQQPTDLRHLFKVQPSDYWHTHYVFDKAAPRPSYKTIGDSTVDSLLVNTVIPLLFVYGAERSEPHYQDRALDWLQTIAAENNTIMEHWQQLLPQLSINNAAQTQALLQLKKAYCSERRCLWCAIGNKIITTTQ